MSNLMAWRKINFWLMALSLILSGMKATFLTTDY